MSFAFIEYADGTIDYQEDVTPSWGSDGSLMLETDKNNYSWVNLGFIKSLKITDDPIEIVEIEYDDAEEEDDAEDGS